MSKVTADMTITLDGHGSGRGQSVERPFGDLDSERLHGWMFEHADENAEQVAAITAAGAYVMGRHMFGPDRGGSGTSTGAAGGATIRRTTLPLLPLPPSPAKRGDGGRHRLPLRHRRDRSGAQAGPRGGGRPGGLDRRRPGTTNQYLAAGLIGELRLHVAPFVTGGGERMFDDAAGIELTPAASRTTPHVTHLVYRR